MTGQNATNLNTLKESNLALVIRNIRAHRCSRASLSSATGLKQGAITKIVGQLIDWGLVSETDAMESHLGRRPVALKLNSDRYLVYGVRIQRSYLVVSVYDMEGRVYAFREKQLDMAGGAHNVMRHLKDMMRKSAEGLPSKPLAVGVALPGPFDSTNGRIALMSGFPGWDEIDIRHELEEAFGIPVCLEHDANCGALAEIWYGGYANSDNLLYILAGEGVGAGMILNGRIFRGRQGFAGEVGHMSINMYGPTCECGNRGCLEIYASTGALVAEYKRLAYDLLDTPPSREELYVPYPEILRKVAAGNDPVARRAYERVVSTLGFGVASIINIFNPNTVIFADRLTAGGPCFLDIVTQTLKKYLLPDVFDGTIVAISKIDGDPMLLGAGALAFDYLITEPSTYFKPPQNTES
jgi:N-acetylglucosamine repressor